MAYTSSFPRAPTWGGGSGGGGGGGGPRRGRGNPYQPPWQGGGPGVRSFNVGDYTPDQAWSKRQTNQLANRGINQLSASTADRLAALKDSYAGTGAPGALAERNDETMMRSGREAVGLRTEAGLQTHAANLKHGLDRARLQLGARGQDIGREGTLGQLRLGERGQDISQELGHRGFDVTQRGQDVGLLSDREGRDLSWDQSTLGAEMTGRGQNLGWLQSVLGAQTTQRGQDVQSQGQRMQYDLGNRGQNLGWLQSMLGAQTTQRGQDVTSRGQDLSYDLGSRGQDLTARGQDMTYNLGGRGQDIQAHGQNVAAVAQSLGLDVDQFQSILGYLSSLYGRQDRLDESSLNRAMAIFN